MIDPKKQYGHETEKFKNLGMEINSLLRGFNMEKADKLLKIPEFSALLMQFLNRKTVIEEILGSEEGKLREVY
jgi:hypothetical protein